MDFTGLRSLLAVADAGTITEAAETGALSQSALSRRLQQLERDLGVDLFVRLHHGVELTEAGREVVAESRRLVERYDELRHRLAGYAGLERGTVRVGGGATATTYLLPSSIAAFQDAHPAIRFRVTEAGSEPVARAVAAGDLDLAIVTRPVADDGVELSDLVEDEIVLVARSDHPLARRRVVRPADLHGAALVAFESRSAIRRLIDGALLAAGVRVDVVMELRSIASMLRMVEKTGSLAFVSRLGLEAGSTLQALEVRGFELTRHLAIATRRGVPLPPAAAAFAALLREHVEGV